MTDPINTQNRMRSTGVTGDNRASGAAKAGGQAAAGKAAGQGGGDATVVELSNASLLEELSERIKNLPEVNDARVEAVKRSLTNGEYRPDAEVIARKYSEIEKLLP